MVFHIDANRMRIVKLLSVKTASPTVKSFIFKDEECVGARPGQFLMLWIPGVDEIPLSILDASTDGMVSVAVRNVGEATLALHDRKVGDMIGVRGPFGNSFKIRGRRLLMVGGGTGIVPLFFLAKRAVQKRLEITFIMGAKTRAELLFRSEVKKLGKDRLHLITSTEDGTCGITGLCTEPLEETLSKKKFSAVYACGPEKMVLRAFELTHKETPMQASLERIMRCGIGLCGSCVIGGYRVCADGPVFTSKQLDGMKHEFGFSKRDRYGREIPLE